MTLSEIGELDSCILCGCMMHPEIERRYKQLQYIAWLVTNSCTPTPFVHRQVLLRAKTEREQHRILPPKSDTPCPCTSEGGLPDSLLGIPSGQVCQRGDRAPFCIACINWVRR